MKTVHQILQTHFPPEQYALIFELRNGTGFSATRSCDVFAMNLWASRGLEINGIERKYGRGDWLKELKTPAKADEFYRYCDRWWLLTEQEGVAKLDEIPKTWGWMHIKNEKIKIMKPAPANKKVKPLTKALIANLLRRSCEGKILREDISDKLAEARADGVRMESENHRFEQRQHESLKEAIKKFEEKSGVKIELWDGGRIGEAVRLVQELGLKTIEGRFESIARMSLELSIQAADACLKLKTEIEKEST